MLAVPIKKRRQCGPKTRDGCQTCKIRRVKCDEVKPNCLRCTSTGRHCDGYPRSNLHPLHLDEAGPFTTIQSMVTHVPGSTKEKRAFQYFVTGTASELSGFYSSAFWGHLILQASISEPSLRHAVIAIGSLHEEFSNRRLGYMTEEGNAAQTFATNQYTKAIGHLRRSLETGKHDPLTALMSCVLFVCFDSLRGNFESAMVHLQSGLKILRDVRARNADGSSHLVDKIIAPLFMRLSVQSILYVDTRETPERRAFVAGLALIGTHEMAVPEMFEDLEEARAHMNHTANILFRMMFLCDGDEPMGKQAIEAHDMYATATERLEQWNVAFEKFMKAKSISLGSKELRGAALLKIHHTVANVMADVIPDKHDARSVAQVVNDQARFEKYNNDFRIMLNLSKSLCAAAEQDIKNGYASLTFSTDLGLVGPLYYLCVRCQDRSLREQALQVLLRCPRREGMWDSESGVELIREFWKMEEIHKNLLPDVPLNEVLDLRLSDGMKWEWEWKGHDRCNVGGLFGSLDGLGSSECSASCTDSLGEISSNISRASAPFPPTNLSMVSSSCLTGDTGKWKPWTAIVPGEAPRGRAPCLFGTSVRVSQRACSSARIKRSSVGVSVI